jgi:hypothetical protein
MEAPPRYGYARLGRETFAVRLPGLSWVRWVHHWARRVANEACVTEMYATVCVTMRSAAPYRGDPLIYKPHLYNAESLRVHGFNSHVRTCWIPSSSKVAPGAELPTAEQLRKHGIVGVVD